MKTKRLSASFALLFIVLAACVRSSVTQPVDESRIIARATTWEWLADFPGSCTEPVAPTSSLPRGTCQCANGLTVGECEKIVPCAQGKLSGPECDRVKQHLYGSGGGVRPPIVNPYWLQSAWAIDPANTTGCASNSNNCSQTTCGSAGSNQGPCLSWDEIVAREATTAPVQPQSTAYSILSSQPNADHPIIFNPILVPVPPDSNVHGATVSIVCSTSVAASTTITALTAKVTSTNTRFLVTLGSAPTQVELIQDTTASNSIAWIGRSATSHALSQPAAPVTLSTTGTNPGAGAENNAWAMSDTVNLLSLPSVVFAQVVPTLAGMSGNGNVTIQHCLIDQTPPTPGQFSVQPGDDPFTVSPGVAVVESVLNRAIYVAPIAGPYNTFASLLNDNFIGGVNVNSSYVSPGQSLGTTYPPLISSGVIGSQNGVSGTGSVSINGAALINDVDLIVGSGTNNGVAYFGGYNYIGELHIEQGTTVKMLGGATFDAQTSGSYGGPVWGIGAIDAYLGTVLYSAATTAPTTFSLSTLRIQGGTTACCATIAAPSTLNCGVTLATANFDGGTCSSSSLSNRAFLPGGGSWVGL